MNGQHYAKGFANGNIIQLEWIKSVLQNTEYTMQRAKDYIDLGNYRYPSFELTLEQVQSESQEKGFLDGQDSCMKWTMATLKFTESQADREAMITMIDLFIGIQRQSLEKDGE